MTHVRFTAGELCLPDDVAIALDHDFAVNVREVSADNQFRSDCALPQLRGSQIEIVLRFGDVVGKLVSLDKANAVRRSLRANDIRPGYFRLVAAVFSEVRNEERFTMSF